MNPTDAREQLINQNPNFSYQVIEERWYNHDITHKQHTLYVVSILPGLDGNAVTQFRDTVLESVLNDAIQSLKLHETRRP